MKRFAIALAAVVLAGFAATAVLSQPVAGQEKKVSEVHGTGCVQAGVEAGCLVLRDLRSGKLYSLLFKEPRPAVGDGIEFTALPHDGVTMCMQGVAVDVTGWARKDSLKCSLGDASGR
jgi:hypothetical protein